MIRQRRFRLGQRVKLHDLSTEGAGNAYPLPPGWSHGEEVTVIGFDHGYVRVLGDGKESTVFIVNIDSGWDEWVDGKWRGRPRSQADGLSSPDSCCRS
jgi:hypothetical protein